MINKKVDKEQTKRRIQNNNKQPHFTCRLLIIRVATTGSVLLIIYLNSIELGRD